MDMIAAIQRFTQRSPRREASSTHRQCDRELTVPENLHAIAPDSGDNARILQDLRVNFRTRREGRQLGHVDLSVVLGEDVREAALRQAAQKGHLATLEPQTLARAGAGLLALGAAARGLPEPRALTATHAGTGALSPYDGMQIGEFISHGNLRRPKTRLPQPQ